MTGVASEATQRVGRGPAAPAPHPFLLLLPVGSLDMGFQWRVAEKFPKLPLAVRGAGILSPAPQTMF